VDFLVGKSFPFPLYHEKRISLVTFFVFLLLLKNIVHGRKGYLKVEKRFQIENVLFYFSITIAFTHNEYVVVFVRRLLHQVDGWVTIR
jgi:hypothetical protein